jgi:hypothetical protein
MDKITSSENTPNTNNMIFSTENKSTRSLNGSTQSIDIRIDYENCCSIGCD